MSKQDSPIEPPRQSSPSGREPWTSEGPVENGIQGSQERTASKTLSLWVRISLLMVGWLLVLIGIAGLVLPGIQGIATILFGAAVLSLASEMVYELMRRGFQRWPSVWDRFEKFREKMHGWLHRRT